jgi:hypothetical protein
MKTPIAAALAALALLGAGTAHADSDAYNKGAKLSRLAQATMANDRRVSAGDACIVAIQFSMNYGQISGTQNVNDAFQGCMDNV